MVNLDTKDLIENYTKSLRYHDIYVTVTAKPEPVLPEKLVDRYPGPFSQLRTEKQ